MKPTTSVYVREDVWFVSATDSPTTEEAAALALAADILSDNDGLAELFCFLRVLAHRQHYGKRAWLFAS